MFDTGGLTVNSVRAPCPAEMAFCHATQSYLLRIFQVLHIFHFLSDQPDELSFRSRDDVFNSAVVVVRLKFAHLSEEVDHLDFWSNFFDCNLVGKVEFWLAIWLANRPDVQETLRGIWQRVLTTEYQVHFYVGLLALKWIHEILRDQALHERA